MKNPAGGPQGGNSYTNNHGNMSVQIEMRI